jgi:hypothetical protein
MKIYLLYLHEQYEGVLSEYKVFKTVAKAQATAQHSWRLKEKWGNEVTIITFTQKCEGQWEARCTSDGRKRFVILELEVK